MIQMEKWELGIRIREAAVKYWSKQSEPHAYLGVSLFNHGRQPEAHAEFETALTLASENATALSCQTLISELSGDPQEAIKLYNKGLALAPDDQQFKTRLSNLIQKPLRHPELPDSPKLEASLPTRRLSGFEPRARASTFGSLQ